MRTATQTSSEQLEPEINKMIDGAKQAVDYFKALHQASLAMVQVVKSQLDYAESELEKLNNEKNAKYGESSN